VKLATFTRQGQTRIGLVYDSEIVDLAAAVPDLPQEVCAFLRAGQPALDAARRPWRTAPPGCRGAMSGSKRQCSGQASSSPLASTTESTPPHPPLNFRLVTCINAPYGDLWLPRKPQQFDYELECTAVIGRRCRGITRAQVPLVVVGYTIFNDGSARDYQRQVHNNLGKSWDTHGPLGPWIVTADEIADPHNLEFWKVGAIGLDFAEVNRRRDAEPTSLPMPMGVEAAGMVVENGALPLRVVCCVYCLFRANLLQCPQL
jgi:hypothetical protein